MPQLAGAVDRYALNGRELISQLLQFGLQRALEGFEVAFGRPISLLFRHEAKAAHLVEKPLRRLAIAK